MCKKTSLFYINILLSLLLVMLTFSACNNSATQNEQTPQKNDQTSSEESSTKPTSPKPTSKKVNVTFYRDVQIRGIAVINFTMDDNEYYGAINSTGEVIYHTTNSIYIKSISDNYGCIYETVDKNEKIGIINFDNGEIKWFEDGAFDKIIGYGDDLILTYKSNSTIDVSEHVYSIIDAKSGKTVKQHVRPKQLSHPGNIGNGITRQDYMHIGDGWFLSKSENSGVRNEWRLYDSNNDIVYSLDPSIQPVGDSFINGKIYMTTSDDDPEIHRINSNNQMERIDIPYSLKYHFSFNQSGQIEVVSPFSSGANGLIVTYKDVENLQLIDTTTQTTYEYTQYPTNMIQYVKVYDDYCIVSINGADYKDYFTVINKKGEQLFEPKQYIEKTLVNSELKLSEDRIIYQCESKSSNMFDMCKIYDLNGQELFTIDYIDNDEIIEFHNGIFMNDDKYIDKFGNEIEIVLKN